MVPLGIGGCGSQAVEACAMMGILASTYYKRTEVLYVCSKSSYTNKQSTHRASRYLYKVFNSVGGLFHPVLALFCTVCLQFKSLKRHHSGHYETSILWKASSSSLGHAIVPLVPRAAWKFYQYQLGPDINRFHNTSHKCAKVNYPY